MITSLKILNYALIEHLDISFSEGMTSITGETGAGKSILMGGLSLVLGKRADLNVLKDDKKKCIVEAIFLIDNYQLKEFFEEAELDYEAETVLRREIIPGGKSRAFINDTPVTLDKINQLSNFLIDVHSQNENQFLFKSEYQFLVLDALANNDELLDEYRKHLNQFNQTQLEYNELLLKVNILTRRHYNGIPIHCKALTSRDCFYFILKSIICGGPACIASLFIFHTLPIISNRIII